MRAVPVIMSIAFILLFLHAEAQNPVINEHCGFDYHHTEIPIKTRQANVYTADNCFDVDKSCSYFAPKVMKLHVHYIDDIEEGCVKNFPQPWTIFMHAR